MGVIADWTTAGPYKSLSWLIIAFTIGVLVTLILTIIEQVDAWKTFKAVKGIPSTNEEMEVLATSTLIRSTGRVGIQLSFLVLATSNILISIREDFDDLYWYRIVFVISILLPEALLCMSAINDIVARHKLQEYIKESKDDE